MQAKVGGGMQLFLRREGQLVPSSRRASGELGGVLYLTVAGKKIIRRVQFSRDERPCTASQSFLK
jgi:hypothetical protein